MEKNFNGLVDFIKGNSLNTLIDNYEICRKNYLRGGYLSYKKCQINFFMKRHDYKRLIWNLLIKRFFVKPYLHTFETELPPAFYQDNGNVPTFYEAIESLKNNIDAIAGMKFVDQKSYDVLASIIAYRLTANKNFLFEHIDFLEKIYFHDEITAMFRHDWKTTIIDCGAYDGDTLTQFYIKYPEQLHKNQYYCFEADPANYQKLLSKAEQLNAVCYNFAAGSCEKTAYLNANGEGSHLGGYGDEIEVHAIDNVINKPVTYIKMDIEGSELDALLGCKKHITNGKPVLAISIYHKLSDIYKIYEFINSLNLGYDFAVRKYGSTISEAVLYAF